MQGILSSNNDNLSNIAALLNGKSACTTIRFERRRLLSNAFTLSAGRALTRGDRADSHGKWSILWEATATGYGLVAMEKMCGRREDSRARFCGKRERVEREGRYGREKVSENEMKVRIGIGDIWGVCIQMWPLMQCVNFERAGHEIGYNRSAENEIAINEEREAKEQHNNNNEQTTKEAKQNVTVGHQQDRTAGNGFNNEESDMVGAADNNIIDPGGTEQLNDIILKRDAEIATHSKKHDSIRSPEDINDMQVGNNQNDTAIVSISQGSKRMDAAKEKMI
ncbi:hypothetical protein A4A49_44115, partial [Nicotiana attenuata]